MNNEERIIELLTEIRDSLKKPEKKQQSRFIPPTRFEVAEYCKERNNNVSASDFVDHYQSNNWMRGKAKIKDWKACVRTWEKNGSNNNGQRTTTSRAKQHQDKLREIAERDIKQNGHTDFVG